MHRETTKWLNTIHRYGIKLPATCYGEYNRIWFNCSKMCEFRPEQKGNCKEFAAIMTLPIEKLAEYIVSDDKLMRAIASMRMAELTYDDSKRFDVVITLPAKELPEYLIADKAILRKIARIHMEK